MRCLIDDKEKNKEKRSKKENQLHGGT